LLSAQKFLADKYITVVLPLTPYSPDLTLHNFFSFVKIKITAVRAPFSKCPEIWEQLLPILYVNLKLSSSNASSTGINTEQIA